MRMPGQTGAASTTEPTIPDTAPPPPAKDHLADLYYDPAAMTGARRMMLAEMGGARISKAMLNLAEFRTGAKGDGYRWGGQAWFGDDIHRLVFRSEGEGSAKGGLETGEVQALFSRAVGRYLDLQGGVRQDLSPRGRTYLTLGAQNLLPYWFDVEGALFLSTKGELLARAEGTYDLRLFQRVVLQPRVELNFAARNSPQTRTGSGLSNAELGLRLRYEIRREFAPYVGVSWDRRLGPTADYWRAAGERPAATTFVVGLRAWF
jgi:copper resistance protein B